MNVKNSIIVAFLIIYILQIQVKVVLKPIYI